MRRNLRIGSLQLSPVFKDVPASITRANDLLKGVLPYELDLLVLPELAFTGYCFTSREDIEPFVENVERHWNSARAPTTRWAAETAQRLRCYVAIGLPTRQQTSRSTPNVLHNSQLLVNPDGTFHSVYHKHSLYERDESWSTEGLSFTHVDLPFPPSAPGSPPRPGKFRLLPCICMDLNPYRFTAPFDAFELATFGKENDVDVVLCSMAWLDQDSSEKEPETSFEAVRSTIGYWVARLEPLLGSGATFVASNRIGTEGDVKFTGSSTILSLAERPTVISYASKDEEKLVRGEVELPTEMVN